MKSISFSIESLVIQSGVGRWAKRSFKLSNFPSLTVVLIGQYAFWNCSIIVFDGENS